MPWISECLARFQWFKNATVYELTRQTGNDKAELWVFRKHECAACAVAVPWWPQLPIPTGFSSALHGAQGLSHAVPSFLFTATHPLKAVCTLLPTCPKPYTDPVTSCAFPSSQPFFFWELPGEGSHRIVNNRSSPSGCVRLLRPLGFPDKETISTKHLPFVPAIYWVRSVSRQIVHFLCGENHLIWGWMLRSLQSTAWTGTVVRLSTEWTWQLHSLSSRPSLCGCGQGMCTVWLLPALQPPQGGNIPGSLRRGVQIKILSLPFLPLPSALQSMHVVLSGYLTELRRERAGNDEMEHEKWNPPQKGKEHTHAHTKIIIIIKKLSSLVLQIITLVF